MNRILSLFVLAAALTAAWISNLAAEETEAQKPDIVIADFETDNFDGWTAEGNAFQLRSADALYTGGMGAVYGFHGQKLINTLASVDSDNATGTLTSPEFKI